MFLGQELTITNNNLLFSKKRVTNFVLVNVFNAHVLDTEIVILKINEVNPLAKDHVLIVVYF